VVTLWQRGPIDAAEGEERDMPRGVPKKVGVKVNLELITRISVVPLDADQGSLREALLLDTLPAR
jgi:hypothetical protein